jgi:hypothetical protein
MKTTKLLYHAYAARRRGSGRSTTAAKSPDVADSIRTSLDQAGFKSVSISQTDPAE